MKYLPITLALITTLQAVPPGPGDPSENVHLTLATNYDPGSFNYNTLTDQDLSHHSGRVVVLTYIAPW